MANRKTRIIQSSERFTGVRRMASFIPQKKVSSLVIDKKDKGDYERGWVDVGTTYFLIRLSSSKVFPYSFLMSSI